MPSFLVTFKSGPNAGRSFIIEDICNEADAINQAFERAGENCLDCGCYTKVDVQQLPLGPKR